MITDDIKYLRCVDCAGELDAHTLVQDGDAIIEGILECTKCHRHYPILETVGIFFRKEVLADFLDPREEEALRQRGWIRCLDSSGAHDDDHQRQRAVAQNWEYQWGEVAGWWQEHDFNQDGCLGADAFWTFIPLARQDIVGKKILVAAGGLGREAYHLAKEKPSRLFVNEIGTEIYKTRSLVEGADRLLILMRSDMIHLPMAANSVDVTICDHALQHVPNHRRAYARLTEVTAAGGRVAVCVYSEENNLVMTHCVEPAKALFHHLPLKGQRYLSWPFAIVIYAVIHGVYGLADSLFPSLARRLPLYPHMMLWRQNSWSWVWLACFDLIHAPVSFHFRREDMENLAAENGLKVLTLVNTNTTLWSMVAERPAAV